MSARSWEKAKAEQTQSDNPAADGRVAVVITKCTLEVQQFADKVDD
jgi:hypothetical protein